MKIFKYVIPIEGTIHNIPSGSKFLSCQLQNNQISVWYLVNPDIYTTPVKFSVFGTGHEIPDTLTPGNFLSTLQFGPIVFHIFAEQTLGQSNDNSLQDS